MTLRTSEPPAARRARSFLRRWHRGRFREYVESQAMPPGGPVALVDIDYVPLAVFRGETKVGFDLALRGCIDVGDPVVARLVGDVHTLDPAFVELVRFLVLLVDDFERETEQLSRHALERYRELSLLYDFSEKASSATALDQVMAVVLRKAVDVVRASGAALLTSSPDADAHQVLAMVGVVPAMTDAVLDRVMESEHPLVGNDLELLHAPEGDDWSETLACIPLRTAGRPTGVLVVQAGTGRALRPEDQRLLTALSSLAATRIEQARLTETNVRKRELAAIGHVASGIVHDFKNPLTAMRGFAEMIQMGHVPAEEYASLAGQIIENADRIWAMVDEILHLVRGNRAMLDLRPISGGELGERLKQTLRPSTPERIQLHIDVSRLGQVVVDAKRIERVLVNLVRNSFEAITGVGHVNVAGHSVGDDSVQIVVEDDGPGISSNIRNALFDPFVTAGKTGGTGLGLAIVRKIVEEHGGSVAVESEPGRGARFILTLPRTSKTRDIQAW